MATSVTPEQFLAGTESGVATFRWVCDVLTNAGLDFTVSTSKSQVAFRRRRGFAYLWMPGQHLRHADAEVVLSLGLENRIPSSRFKEVARATPTMWMHHLEIHSLDDLDDEVARWLKRAAEAAGPPTR